MRSLLTIVAAIAAVVSSRADAEVIQLANGLHVVLAPDPTAGSVVVHVRYAGGSDDGPARIVEHALTGGSPHVERGTFAHALDALGGWDNATTAPDHTSVFEQLPASALPYVLFVEADRMAGTAIGPVASNERERADIAGAIHAAVWERPPSTSSVDDARALWRTHFQPRGAILVVTGGFDAAQARAWIERDFGWIPSATAAPTPVAKPGPLANSTTIAIDAPTTVPRVITAARTDVAMSPAALEVELAARILAGGRGSRLYRTLVTTDQVASDVSMTAWQRTNGGEVAITVDARDRASQPAIATAIAAEIAALADKGVTAGELARAKTHAITELVAALEDLSFRADILAAWTVEGVADLAAARARIEAVTADGVRDGAKRWLAHVVTATVSP